MPRWATATPARRFAGAGRKRDERLIAAALRWRHPDQLCLAIGELLGKTTGGIERSPVVDLLHGRRHRDEAFEELAGPRSGKNLPPCNTTVGQGWATDPCSMRSFPRSRARAGSSKAAAAAAQRGAETPLD